MNRLPVRERAFQDAIVELANTLGWRAAHFRNARTAAGSHVTAVAYQGKGYPDLTLVRERVVFAEIKAPTGRLTAEQEAWVSALESAGAEVYVWKPRDWDQIEAVLKTKGA